MELPKILVKCGWTKRYALNVLLFALAMVLWGRVLNTVTSRTFLIIFTTLAWFIPFFIMVSYELQLQKYEELKKYE